MSTSVCHATAGGYARVAAVHDRRSAGVAFTTVHPAAAIGCATISHCDAAWRNVLALTSNIRSRFESRGAVDWDDCTVEPEGCMSRHYIMCRPTYFAVDYAINPWMDPTMPVDTDLAIAQWETLRQTYLRMGHTVELVDPMPGLPDMVFTANGATIIDGKMLGSQFRYPQRAAEAPAFLDWGDRAGLATQEAKAVNEGEGDILLAGELVLAGFGPRTDLAAHAQAQELFGRPVISLQLVDPRYYHLDTALCVLRPDRIAYLPSAFSEGSQAVLRQLYPDALLARAEDAAAFGLNAVSDGRHVVLPVGATAMARKLATLGYEPVPVDVSELLKAGGGPKCCTLEVRR